MYNSISVSKRLSNSPLNIVKQANIQILTYLEHDQMFEVDLIWILDESQIKNWSDSSWFNSRAHIRVQGKYPNSPHCTISLLGYLLLLMPSSSWSFVTIWVGSAPLVYMAFTFNNVAYTKSDEGLGGNTVLTRTIPPRCNTIEPLTPETWHLN